MTDRARSLGIFLALGLAATFAVADQTTVVPLLRKNILDPNTTRLEAETYLVNHVAPMPDVKSVAEWEKYAGELRKSLLEQVFLKGEASRWREAATRVEWLDTIPGGPGYQIRKLRFEALPGFWVPALLYLPDRLTGKVPVVLNVNGHTPLDTAYVPKQIRCINLAKRGMIAMNLGWIGWGQLGANGYDHYRLNQIDLCGTSGLAPFYLSLERALDILLALPNADPKRVAMAGLSGGGWQTIVFGALDPRVTLADPVAGFSDFKMRARFPEDLGDSEQAPVDMASIADYTHLVALRAPRPTLLTFNSKDGIFTSGRTLPPLLAAAEPIFRLYGRPQNLRSHVNEDPGTHNFLKDNRQAFYRMLGDFFYPKDKKFSAEEIASDSEVKTGKELNVPLPEPNEDLHTLAVALSKNLPRDPVIPSDETALAAWRQEGRARLRALLRAKDYSLTAEPAGKETTSIGEEGSFWRLKVGSDPTERWTVPAVEITDGEPKNTVILLADCGRASTQVEFDMLLAYGSRVIAMDPLYIGESLVHSRIPIHISASGGRPLGVDAAQVAAVARWLATDRGLGPVKVIGAGPRSGLIALAAAALEEKAISGVDLHYPLKSLREAIDRNLTIEDAPELFTFGLLEQFDIPQLIALVSPRPVIER
jgi:hypothetical protein